MNNTVAELMKWIDEQRAECVSISMRLIREDAPKNKFSVITGKMDAFDEVQVKIEQLEKEKSPA